MRRACVTGGAGFIGSHLVDRLIQRRIDVVVVDDFRTGRKSFLEDLRGNQHLVLIEEDVLSADLKTVLTDCDWVFHLQANADVRHGTEHPTLDLEQNTVATSRILEAMRLTGVKQFLFASTGSVYGEPDIFPTPENAPFPLQTSLYGASKAAGECLASAYASGFGFTSIICRFVSVLGERYTHGHVVDFFRSLRKDSRQLHVLGDGRQRKSYMYVQDCVDAMLLVAEHHSHEPGSFVYNLGTDDTITIDESVEVIVNVLGVRPEVVHLGGTRGWIGDSPFIHLDTTKINSLGWNPQTSIPEAIIKTVHWLEDNDDKSQTSVADQKPEEFAK